MIYWVFNTNFRRFFIKFLDSILLYIDSESFPPAGQLTTVTDVLWLTSETFVHNWVGLQWLWRWIFKANSLFSPIHAMSFCQPKECSRIPLMTAIGFIVTKWTNLAFKYTSFSFCARAWNLLSRQISWHFHNGRCESTASDSITNNFTTTIAWKLIASLIINSHELPFPELCVTWQFRLELIGLDY